MSRSVAVAIAITIVGCKSSNRSDLADQSDPPPATTSAAPLPPPRPPGPPEPPPPYAQGASEVPGLEAKLAADAAYQKLCQGGAEADVFIFLTGVSQLLSEGAFPSVVAQALGARKLKDAAINLYLIHSRINRYPEDFTARVEKVLEAAKTVDHLGTWVPSKPGAPPHDFSVLAAWLHKDDPAYVRELLAAKRTGPIPWHAIDPKKPPDRMWLADERSVLDWLAGLTTLTPDEQQRLAYLKSTKLGDTFRLGDFSYVVTNVSGQKTIGNSFVQKNASEGGIYLVVKYTIENLGSETESVLADDFRIIDKQGRKFTPSAEANTALAMSGDMKDLFLAQVQPGLKHAMATAFEIPEAAAYDGFTLVIPEKGLLGTKKVEIGLVLKR